MYIKQVVIHGFKSYRDHTVVVPFHKGNNVVVGRNGSGKSNFFSAIEFVLTVQPIHKKHGLIHVSEGQNIMSSYVEVIIDNSDHIMPIPEDEVRIRRVIKTNSDSYMLNNSTVTHKDIINLLESSGFSHLNPFYIIRQGKINKLATESDKFRLQLLKAIAGAQVHDDQQTQVLQKLRDSKDKMELIGIQISELLDRFKRLNEEREEFEEYKRHDDIRKTLEVLINEKQIDKTNLKINTLKLEQMVTDKKTADQLAKLSKVDEDLKQCTNAVKEAHYTILELKVEIDQIEGARDCLYQRQSKLEVQAEDVLKELNSDTADISKNANDLRQLDEAIQEKTVELESKKEEYETLKSQRTNLELKKIRRETFMNRGEMGTKHHHKLIRDRLTSVDKNIRECNSRLTKIQENDSKKQMCAAKADECSKELEEYLEELKPCDTKHKELIKNREQVQEIIQDLSVRECSIQHKIRETKASFKQGQNNKTMAKVANDHDIISKVMAAFASRGGSDADIINQYHGLVADHFKYEENLRTAVEVTAGKESLFSHLVDTDVACTKIIQEMNRQRLRGSLRLMPLNRTQSKTRKYPEPVGVKDMVPMINRIKYDQKFEHVMKHIFGNTLLCRTSEAADKYARQGFNCVTLDGDRVTCGGILSGGYFDPTRSWLNMYRSQLKLKEKIDEYAAELVQITENLNTRKISVDNIIEQLKVINEKRTGLRINIDLKQNSLKEWQQVRSKYIFKELSIEQCKSELETLQQKREALLGELEQNFDEILTEEQQEELEQLDIEIDNLEKAVRDNSEAYENLTKEIDNQLSEIRTLNLKRRHIQDASDRISTSHESNRPLLLTAELEEINNKIQANKDHLKSANEKMDEIQTICDIQKKKVEDCKAEKEVIMGKMGEDNINLYHLEEERQRLEGQKAELKNKILPASALYDEYAKYSLHKLAEKLKKVNKTLKKYCHVNKRVEEQFERYSKEKDDILKRRDYLNKEYKVITDLLSLLDSRKSEAILYTFKQVGKYFSGIFKELVPTGHAKIVLLHDEDEESETDTVAKNVDKLVGLAIRVSFLPNVEMSDMNQLSGGQKSLVALALIFAIQKCNPAPFYLFDEIDQALDQKHRQAIAKMINDLSKKAQFITTTFRPELLEHADQCYGVKFRNNASHVDCITSEEAKKFVSKDGK